MERLGEPLMTQAECAKKLGISRAEVSKLEALVLCKVATRLKELVAVDLPNLQLLDA